MPRCAAAPRPAAPAATPRRQALLEDVGAAVDGRAVQLGLGAEVLVDQGLGDAGALGQLGGADPVVAALRERARRQLKDALAALVAADPAARLVSPAFRRSFHVLS